MFFLRFCIIILLLTISVDVFAADIEKQLLCLDSCINQKRVFDNQKEERLLKLKSDLKQSSNHVERYGVCYKLFDEYKSYNFDSAFYYAQSAVDEALKLKNADFLTEAQCAVVFCYLSAGLYKEAFDLMSKVDTENVSENQLKTYYTTWARLCYDMADYNNTPLYEKFYVEKGNLYTDTLLQYIPENSPDKIYALAQQKMKSHDFNSSIELFQKLATLDSVDSRLLAIVYSCIGWNHWIEGREDEAISYLVKSAICDIQSSVKENTSTCSLANILYNKGDIKRAVSYAQSSLEDANFYGARHRKIQVGQILPIIEQDRYRLVEHQRNLSILAAAVAALFILVLLVSTIIIRRQVKKLNKAHKIIDERNKVLEQTNQTLLNAQQTINLRNQALQQTNASLAEANRIKITYIGKSFYANAEYINKVEKLYKMVDRKIVARQFDDLRSAIKESTLIAERKNMFAGFDETFLKLFPDFVEKFNLLFDEKDRRLPEEENSLTNEMRIFALIRLGVNDSERIANFLNYSVHTVNTYKTRIKNRSIVENDLFEQKIMEI